MHKAFEDFLTPWCCRARSCVFCSILVHSLGLATALKISGGAIHACAYSIGVGVIFRQSVFSDDTICIIEVYPLDLCGINCTTRGRYVLAAKKTAKPEVHIASGEDPIWRWPVDAGWGLSCRFSVWCSSSFCGKVSDLSRVPTLVCFGKLLYSIETSSMNNFLLSQRWWLGMWVSDHEFA